MYPSSMKKLLLLIFVFFVNDIVFGQNIIPFKPEANYETWAIKGKVLPWMGIQSGQLGVNSLIGFEYGFKRRNTIGVDFYFNRWKENEDRYDSTLHETVYKYAFRYRDKAVFINYRF